jgi:hypothetical protein
LVVMAEQLTGIPRIQQHKERVWEGYSKIHSMKS